MRRCSPYFFITTTCGSSALHCAPPLISSARRLTPHPQRVLGSTRMVGLACSSVQRFVHTDRANSSEEENDEDHIAALEKIANALYEAEADGHGIVPSLADDAALLVTRPAINEATADEGLVDDMMDVLMNLDVDVRASDSLSPSHSAVALLSNAAERGASASLLALLAAADDATPRTPVVSAATELLTTGLDVKAVLAGRPLVDLHMSQKSLRQCDLSLLSFQRVTCEGCDFRRSVFYRAQFAQTVFRHCRFDGAVLRHVACHGDVLFEDCSFCFADVGLCRSSGSNEGAPPQPHQRAGTRQSGLRFVRCDFDLSTFEGCENLNDPRLFRECRNTQTAHHFPLRARTTGSG